MKNVEFGTYEHLAKKLIFVDGITRCGKSLFNGIIPSLDHVEILHFIYILEQIVPGMAFGAIDPGYAKSLMNLFLNELAYNNQLSRNVNFRSSDQSGVSHYKNPKLYHDRLTRPDGDEIVESIRNSSDYLFFQTHDLMVNLEHLNLLELNYWMISLWRHPVDMIHSWWKRGYGTRFENDPRFFTLTIQHQGKNQPWYAAGQESKCAALNPVELCAYLVMDLVERAVAQYKKNKATHSRIHLATFEDFSQNTQYELAKICSFLGTEATPETERFIREAKCPRVLDPAERRRKAKDFEESINADLYAKLLALSNSYEKNLYGLRNTAKF